MLIMSIALGIKVNLHVLYVNVNYFTHHMYFLFLTQIDKKAMKTSGMVTRVRNEVEIHCQLKHPAILEVINKF